MSASSPRSNGDSSHLKARLDADISSARPQIWELPSIIFAVETILWIVNTPKRWLLCSFRASKQTHAIQESWSHLDKVRWLIKMWPFFWVSEWHHASEVSDEKRRGEGPGAHVWDNEFMLPYSRSMASGVRCVMGHKCSQVPLLWMTSRSGRKQELQHNYPEVTWITF